MPVGMDTDVAVTPGLSVSRVVGTGVAMVGWMIINGGNMNPPGSGVRYVFCQANGVKICILNNGIGPCPAVSISK